MSDREAHGMNCAHRSDSDEHCTCACRYHAAVDTERTMHAAWRKRAEEAERENADLRARLEAAEKARDEQAEAVKVLAHEISEWRLAHVCSPVSLIDAPIIRARKRTANNPTAAAAVKEAAQ